MPSPPSSSSSLPPPLSGKSREGFPYDSLKDRLPVIIVQCIDELHRKNKEREAEEERDEAKKVVEKLSQMRYELLTNKPLTEIDDGGADCSLWNDFLRRQRDREGGSDPRWFDTAWLFAECYAYRRMLLGFRSTGCPALDTEDFFSAKKLKSLEESLPSLARLVATLDSLLAAEDKSSSSVKSRLGTLLRISLWGNRWDLSISSGKDNSASGDPESQLAALERFVLVDDCDEVYDALCGSGGDIVDVVMDNAGFELVSDLCLAEFLTRTRLARTVRFRVKSQPWFVSDTMEHDIWTTLKRLEESSDARLAAAGKRWRDLFDSGAWKICVDAFWTLPHDFSEMRAVDPGLHDELANSKLVVFKGDLNYRKLVGDLDWDVETTFGAALRGFQPAPLVALRTLKANVVTGLSRSKADEACAEDPDWLIGGRWGLIQVHKN